MKEVEIIGAASGWGAQIRGCENGPEAILASGIADSMRRLGMHVCAAELLYPQTRAKEALLSTEDALDTIAAFNRLLSQSVRKAMQSGRFPVVFGGDHVNAVGVWNGVYEALRERPFGLLWIDAHLDAHTPETTPSMAWHGMPVAALLGYGHPKLSHLKHKHPVLLAENLAFIGTRSFEEGEEALLKRLNVKIFPIAEVKERGMEAVMCEALAHVLKNTDHFGVSLDLDILDPEEAPGVGSPEIGGVSSQELFSGLKLLRGHPKLCALEIEEYNPERDVEKKTLHLLPKIIESLCAKKHS